MAGLKNKIKDLIPYRFLNLTGDFWKYYRELSEFENKSLDEVKEFQFRKFKETVTNAYNGTKFYNDFYKERFFHPDDLKNADDIKKTPLTDKAAIREHIKEMIPVNIRGKLHRSTTSGTTGNSLVFYNRKIDYLKEWAAICYQWERIGYKPGDIRIELRGSTENGALFQYIPRERALRMNILKINSGLFPQMAEQIVKSDAKFIHGYPSAVYRFANYALKSGAEFNIQGIMLASETVYDWQLKTIAAAFPGSKIIAHYGQAEKVILAAWNEDQRYHCIPLYGLTETLPENSALIGTSFLSSATPFIRYKLTDIPSGYSESITTSKTLFPSFDNIDGRVEDVILNDKREEVPNAAFTFPFKTLKHISACKIIQEDYENVLVLVEGKENEDELRVESDFLKNALSNILGGNMKIKIERVDMIPLGAGGKFKWLESKIKN